MMKRTAFAVSIALAALIPMQALASDGKDLYQAFQCAGCHGLDAKKVHGNPSQPALAGMSAERVAKAVRTALARGDHAQVGGSSCGEPPTSEQLRMIGEYVAALPQ